jgi:hypothetical protein
MITAKNARRLALRYRAEARRHRATIRQLERDNEDMHESYCTSFRRCERCGHLHDVNLRCTTCGQDPGMPVED